MEKRIYDVAVGEMFIFDGALFVISPFDVDEEKYLSLCLATKNPEWEVSGNYWIDDEQVVSTIPQTLLEAFFL